jgi:hypothetical protein
MIKKNQQEDDFSAFDDVMSRPDDEFASFDSEVKQEDYTPETSMLEAGLRGAAQGATFGMADELTARAESLLTGKPYDQALQESRSEYKMGEEEYPITSALGEVAGGVGQAVGLTALTGGAAAPAAGASALGRIARLGQLAKNVLVPTTKAGAVKNIATAARTGAVMGGLTGIGKSEKEGMESLKDAPSAALAGGVAGGVLGGASEALKAVGGKATQAISKAVEERKLPQMARMLVFGAGKGLKGETFISEGAKDKAKKQVVDTARDVIDSMDSELSDAKDVRNFIVDNSISKFGVSDILDTLKSKVSEVTDVEASPILQRLNSDIKVIMKTPKKGVPQLLNAQGIPIKQSADVNPRQAYNIVKSIRNELNDEKLPEPLRKPLSDAVKELKERINGSVSEEEIQNLLSKNESLLSKYNILRSDATDDVVSTSGEAISGTRNLPTLQMLDSKMNKILSSAETMGINPSKTGLADKFSDERKLSQLFFSLSKDTQSGILGEANFDAAMKELGKASPNLAQKIKASVDPVVKVNEYLRYTEGQAGAGPRTTDRGLIGGVISDIGKYGVEGANLAAYLVSRQPIQTTLRPTVATLNTFKTKLDQKLIANPDNKPVQMFAGMVKNALDQQDESRRAAMLNTLMQYKSFRDMFKDEFPEE